MKSLISYYGGKQRLASKIIPLFPPHAVYCEPFAGGLACLFAKEVPTVSNASDYREVVNDSSDLLINLYRVAKLYPVDLYRLIDATLYSESDYRKSKEILKNPKEYDNLTLAWAYYVNINQSFANGLNKGWGRGVFTRNLAVTWGNRKEQIPRVLERIKNIHISCTDALTCIKQWDSLNTLFYCDPPYPNASQGHYKGYTTSDFQRLIEIVESSLGSFVISCYPTIVQVPNSWVRHDFKAYCSSSGKGKVRANRVRKATQDELGGRDRVESVWVIDRSGQERSGLLSKSARQSSVQKELF